MGATTYNIVGPTMLHVANSLMGFKLCARTPNNMQQGVQIDATCNVQQCGVCLHRA